MPDISPTPSPGVPVPLTRTGACGWDRNPSASGSLQCPSSSPPLHEVETVVTPGAQDAPQGDLPVGFHSLASPGAPQALGFQPYPPWVPPLGGYPAWYGAPPSAPICGYSAPLQPYASIAPLPPLSAYPGYYPPPLHSPRGEWGGYTSPLAPSNSAYHTNIHPKFQPVSASRAPPVRHGQGYGGGDYYHQAPSGLKTPS